MAHPYMTPQKLTIKCVKTNVTNIAASFVSKGSQIERATFETASFCALTDGSRAILHKKHGPDSEFEEGQSYIIKNCNLLKKHGHLYVLLGPSSMKFRSAHLVVSEEAERAALEALCPPSLDVTGEEEDLYTMSGFLSIRGKVEKLQKPRMTRMDVPILDLKLRCGVNLLEVSLWREQALLEFHEGDFIHLSHLRGTVQQNGKGKFHSSNRTSVKIEEIEPVEEEIEIVGVTDVENTCHILSADDHVFKIPPQLYSGTMEAIIKELPMKIKLVHKNYRVISFT